MSREEKNSYIVSMEKFVGAHWCGYWAIKARLFIRNLKRKLHQMTTEAFQKALCQWDELVNRAPRKVWKTYAYNM